MTNVLEILGLKKESMESFDNRLKTFIYWPVEFITSHDMAESGFYYDGLSRENDSVICFACGITISNWKPGQDPNENHKLKKPNCEYLLQISEDPMYPECESISVRQQSFNDWSYRHKVTPESLYKAGFFYEGEGDVCCCYHCGKRINKWTENLDPMQVHKNFSPYCKFFKPTAVQSDDEHLDSNKGCSSVIQKISNLNVEDDKTCCVCFEDPKELALIPCGHMFCSKCSLSFKICPTCRKSVQSTLKVYL